MQDFTSIFSVVPIDWFILGAIVLLVALDSLRSGIGRACSLAVALPLAMLLYSLLAKTYFIGGMTILSSSPFSQALTFGVILTLSYLLARRMGLDFVDGGLGEPVQSLIAGVAIAIIFIVIWLQLPALDTLWHFNDRINAIFAESFRLFWLLCAYAALAFARG